MPLFSPPMTPASPTGPVASAMTSVVRIERDLAPVEQLQLLAGARVAHLDVPAQAPQVVGVQRLAELEHHVVRDVDDGADRPQARAAQALAHPQRRARRRD